RGGRDGGCRSPPAALGSRGYAHAARLWSAAGRLRAAHRASAWQRRSAVTTARAARADLGAAAACRLPASPTHAGAPDRRRADRRARADAARAPERAARLRGVQRPAVPRARSAHRLRRRPEGGVPCRGALPDHARQHRVGRDGRGRLERARGPRRRRRAAGAGAAAAGSAARAVWRRACGRALRAGDRRPMSSEQPEPLRLGVVGLGYWGPNIARNLAAIPGCELAWLCDPRAEQRERLQRAFPGARMTAELADLLADGALDAVMLATPVTTHAALASVVLEAGKHCFVEKPLATTTAEAERVVAAAEDARKVLMVGHLLEYHPA